MRSRRVKTILAVGLALAMTLTGTSMTPGQTANAAKKAKVTLKMNKTSLSLQEGQKSTLKITKKNVKKVKSQKWTTSKKSVATVTNKGKITAKKAGKATIKCKVTYIAKGTKRAKTKSLSCKVTVKAKSIPAPTQRPISDGFPYEDTSNVGAAREVSIVGGTSDKMTVKDNGTVRKELSAMDLADYHMGLGINLGNTMEATLDMAARAEATEATQFETAWGSAITTQKYIDCVHSYGINTLRIPVAWSNMINEDTYEINPKYLGRVEEIVNYALNNGMYAIINIHWDNQWWGQFGACDRLEDNTRVPNEEKRAKAWTRFESYWKQISERFKNYSDHLIFEAANEELGHRLNDEIYKNGYAATLDPTDTTPVAGNLKVAERFDMVNKINQKFVDIVRTSGGNNANRFLLIPGYDTSIKHTTDARYKMPTDIAENGKNKLFASVHFYTPGNFCLDEGKGTYTEANKNTVVNEMSELKKLTDDGYAVIVGECGVVRPSDVDNNVIKWYRDFYTEAKKYHAVPVMWETGQYFNRSEAKLKYKDMAEMWNELTGAKGDTSMDRVTGKENAPAIDTVSVAGKTPVWKWTGKWYKNGGDSVVGDDRYEEGGGTTVQQSDPDPLSKFVPQSKTEASIEGDATEISFNKWGYQSFLKLDMSKYKKPAIYFEFLEGTANDDNVGLFQFGATEEADKFKVDYSVDFWSLNGKAVVLSDNIGLSEQKPWLGVSFGSKPTVTGIYIYEMGE